MQQVVYITSRLFRSLVFNSLDVTYTLAKSKNTQHNYRIQRGTTLFVNNQTFIIIIKTKKLHRKCLKSTKTKEQDCRPLTISYSLFISALFRVINDFG